MKKQELALKKKEPVVKKEEPIVAKKEKPTLKQEELAPKKPEVVLKKEEKTKHGWNWNPFHRKPAASPVNAPPPTATKKEAPVLKKKEPVVKKEELVVTKKEKPVAKNEEVEKKKKKSRGWNLNPFHRKPAASPTTAMPPEPKKPELALKKKEPAVKNGRIRRHEEGKPDIEEGGSGAAEERGSGAEKREKESGLEFESIPSQIGCVTNGRDPAGAEEGRICTQEKRAGRDEGKTGAEKGRSAPPKKEEKKKKSHWYWNPFHRKPDASQSSDESPR